MFEESIVLQKEYQQLLRDNEKLKEKFAMVECAKANRQNLIATV